MTFSYLEETLYNVCENGDIDSVIMLLELKSKHENFNLNEDYIDINGNNAFLIACIENNTDIVEVLLEYRDKFNNYIINDYNINLKNYQGLNCYKIAELINDNLKKILINSNRNIYIDISDHFNSIKFT